MAQNAEYLWKLKLNRYSKSCQAYKGQLEVRYSVKIKKVYYLSNGKNENVLFSSK